MEWFNVLNYIILFSVFVGIIVLFIYLGISSINKKD